MVAGELKGFWHIPLHLQAAVQHIASTLQLQDAQEQAVIQLHWVSSRVDDGCPGIVIRMGLISPDVSDIFHPLLLHSGAMAWH